MGKAKFPNFEVLEEERRLEIRELTMQKGISFPTNEELIMLILGSGTKEKPIRQLASEVLGIVMATNDENLIDNLMAIRGMGRSKALMIAAALEFGKRINRNPQVSFETPAELIPYIQNYSMERQEHFLCICLNGAREVLSIRVICKGAGNMALVSPTEVLSHAVKEQASAIVISHNHPSGNSKPSKADIRTTLRLLLAADTLGIALADHIIITNKSYFSFLEHEFMTAERLMQLLEQADYADYIEKN